MNGVIVLFAAVAMLVIAVGVIGALKRRASNNAACGSAKDESVLLI